MAEQLQLCEPPVAAGPRPAWNDPDVIKSTVQKLAEVAGEWLVEHGDTADDDIEEQLDHALRYAGSTDGYAIAKALDVSFGWHPNSSLVETLDQASDLHRDAFRAMTGRWVQISGIRPKHAVGDVVQLDGHPGTIIRVNEGLAEYTINVPALGHVKPDGSELGTTGTILHWEDVDGAN